MNPKCPSCEKELTKNVTTTEFVYYICGRCYGVYKHRITKPLICDVLRDKLPYGDTIPEI